MPETGLMFIAWTSVETEENAKMLAGLIVEKGLAACVQIDGPICSVYTWEGSTQFTKEYRLMFKFVESQSRALKDHVMANHPYQIPEWVVVRAEQVAEKYLSWAVAVSTRSTL